MLRLIYSNRAEELVAEAARRVRDQQTGSDVLVPVTIVVPNAAVEEYLSFGIARACGVAANLRWLRMTGFAADLVMQSSKARLAGADAMEAMALTLLLDEHFLAQPELAPVDAYLAVGESREAADVRRVQLAARIGRLFEEYSYTRSEMLVGWTGGTSLSEKHRQTEVWQRRVWLAMFGSDGLARSRGLVPLHEAIAGLQVDASGAERQLHVFGFAHFARAFHMLLRRVARAAEVVVYSVTPCEGFWEDVDPREPPLLRLWARPGREHARALNEGAEFDHEDRFVEPPDTLLGQLQRDMLRRDPARDRADTNVSFGADESLLVLEHTSVRRELEAVASEIWRLVEGDETLRFDDIAVLFPEGEAHAYRAHLTAAFREAHDIPHRLVDIPAGGDSIGEAVELLLSLPLGRFTRQEVLRLAIHPAVVASLDGADPGRWLQWCDDLGVVHGADRGDHEDTYIERDVFNWDQGMRRLALGAFMAGDGSGERRPFELQGDRYVPCDVAPSDSRDAAAFGLLVRSLVADARFVRRMELSLKEWAALLCTLVETYIAPPNDAEAEPLAHRLRRIHSIGQIDVGNKPVAYRIAYELARSRSAAPERAHGTGGIVVSRVTSLRSIPFRIVFVCGLGEGRFPSSDVEDPLDLRSTRRQEGDVTGRERDKYAFLELLLGTRDRLYLSYVSRDALTGDALPPSSVIQEILHTLQRGYVGDVESLRRRHPARRWDSRYFPDLFFRTRADQATSLLGTMRIQEARAEARTLALRQDAEAMGIDVGPEQLQARAAESPPRAQLAHHLRISPLPQAAATPPARLVIPAYALVKFLDFPLQGWARFQVGLDELDEDNLMSREDEPFETALRDETLLLREILFASGGQGSLSLSYDEAVHERELRGCGPSGVFARGERAQHLDTLEGWKHRLAALEIPLDSVGIHRFGRAGENASPSAAHPALTIDVDLADSQGVVHVTQVEIVGRTLPMERGNSITLSRRIKESREDWARADRQRATLRAFVDYALLCASGIADGSPHASVSVVSTPEGTMAERVAFETMSRGDATVWLRGLARELLSGPHAYFLPSEAVFMWHRKTPAGPIRPWLETAREMLGDGEGPLLLRSAYGPVPRVQEYPIPLESTALDMILRRFQALLGGNRGGDR